MGHVVSCRDGNSRKQNSVHSRILSHPNPCVERHIALAQSSSSSTEYSCDSLWFAIFSGYFSRVCHQETFSLLYFYIFLLLLLNLQPSFCTQTVKNFLFSSWIFFFFFLSMDSSFIFSYDFNALLSKKYTQKHTHSFFTSRTFVVKKNIFFSLSLSLSLPSFDFVCIHVSRYPIEDIIFFYILKCRENSSFFH